MANGTVKLKLKNIYARVDTSAESVELGVCQSVDYDFAKGKLLKVTGQIAFRTTGLDFYVEGHSRTEVLIDCGTDPSKIDPYKLLKQASTKAA